MAKKLDQEVEPFKPVSKDHTRANRVGVPLETLETHKSSTFRLERKSVDMTLSATKRKKFS